MASGELDKAAKLSGHLTSKFARKMEIMGPAASSSVLQLETTLNPKKPIEAEVDLSVGGPGFHTTLLPAPPDSKRFQDPFQEYNEKFPVSSMLQVNFGEQYCLFRV